MQSPTLKVRLAQLVQKSKKALSLYTSMGRKASRPEDALSERQIEVWRQVTEKLFQTLIEIARDPVARNLLQRLLVVRDDFYELWRGQETELRMKQNALIEAANHADFIRCAELASELISLKAGVQAYQAAHQELQRVIGDSRPRTQDFDNQELINVSPEDQSGQETETLLEHAEMQSKVIPLRRRR